LAVMVHVFACLYYIASHGQAVNEGVTLSFPQHYDTSRPTSGLVDTYLHCNFVAVSAMLGESMYFHTLDHEIVGIPAMLVGSIFFAFIFGQVDHVACELVCDMPLHAVACRHMSLHAITWRSFGRWSLPCRT
jgi:hypothetical protein